MTETITGADPSPETKKPIWDIVDLPPEVYKTYDAEQIGALLFDELEKRGIDPDKVVYSGFEGSKVLEHATFGDRDGTYAVNKAELVSGNLEGRSRGFHSPIEYLEDEDPDVPVIGVFDPSKLLGSDQIGPREHMEEAADEDLAKTKGYLYWATKDKSSLDTATILLFRFAK